MKRAPISCPPQRLHKLIAAAGLASRRQAEQWIQAGRVYLDNKAAKLGAVASANQEIRIDKMRYRVVLESDPNLQVLVLNKPEGVVTTRADPEGRPTVFDRLPNPKKGRWISIGRLDINTTGLLMFTNDGDLANALTHPTSGVDREYACRVHGQVTDDMLQRLRDGVQLEDGLAHFSDIQRAGGEHSNQWFHVVLMEGRHREVRRLWESQQVRVSRLKRVRYGPVFLPSRLSVGRHELLNDSDVATLREDIGLPKQQATLSLRALHGRSDHPIRKRAAHSPRRRTRR